jgi:uncharacterized protein YecT (DUF1311 family)
MNKIILSIIFCLSIVVCSGQLQADMNEEAITSYKKADAELNVVYQKILKEYNTNKVFITNLRKAQRLWIQFRDADIAVKFPDKKEDYGSVQPMCWYNYLTGLTLERTKALQVWIDGIEEGDVCAGSVKTKNN